MITSRFLPRFNSCRRPGPTPRANAKGRRRRPKPKATSSSSSWLIVVLTITGDSPRPRPRPRSVLLSGIILKCIPQSRILIYYCILMAANVMATPISSPNQHNYLPRGEREREGQEIVIPAFKRSSRRVIARHQSENLRPPQICMRPPNLRPPKRPPPNLCS